jgi:TRAP-type C4-dicarboxylate transport system permease small subunit
MIRMIWKLFESNPIHYDEIACLILIEVISVGIVLLMGLLEHLQV